MKENGREIFEILREERRTKKIGNYWIKLMELV